MASITLSLFAVTFTSLIFLVAGQATNNHLRCYNCESQQTKACEDPTDVSVLQLMDCSSLSYPSPRDDDERSITDQVLTKSVDGKIQGGPVIDQIFRGNVAQRSQQSFKYVCLKVVLTAEGLKGTTRTCGKLPSDVKDACDFIKQEADPKLKVHTCYSCEADKCNSASFLVVSGITIISSVLLVMLSQRF